MRKIKEPEEIKQFRFLTGERRAKVDDFVSRLDDTCQVFFQKRYLEGKNIRQIADEMGYTERALFKFRKKVIFLWYVFTNKAS